MTRCLFCDSDLPEVKEYNEDTPCPVCGQACLSYKSKLDVLYDQLGEDLDAFLKFRSQKGKDNWELLEPV